MEKDEAFQEFMNRVSQGNRFEEWERSHWNSRLNSAREIEAKTKWADKEGFMDIRLKLEDDGNVVIVEIKATNWDKLKECRVRPTALRHSRQIWRYIDAHISHPELDPPIILEDPLDVIPAVVYPAPPITPGRKDQVEEILNERGIQVVWRDEYEL